jgi:imidazolonepropionase-like amidohydrolase
MAGTDTPLGFLIPGFSLHIELELLVESGMSELDAIKSATINPSRYFKMENYLGLIKKGYIADLILLETNPLENIKNTLDISLVVKDGKVYEDPLKTD